MKDQHRADKVRIIFMGTSNFAGVILKFLISSPYEISAVFTQPEKKIGRQRQPQPSEVKKIASRHRLKVFEPEKFSEEVIKKLKSKKPDLIIAADYGKILPKEVLDVPRLGALNVHASLLPKFRGPSPIQNAILRGEKETGATVIIMNEKVDAGDIISQKKAKIDPDEAYPRLLLKLANLSGKLLIETIALWVAKKIKPKKQDDSQVTLCQLIDRDDGKVVWANEAENIYNQFRAFYSWPGLFTYWPNNGKNLRIKLNEIGWSKDFSSNKYHLGEVFKFGKEILNKGENFGVGVKASRGVIILKEVQLEGKNKVEIKNFINGHPNFIGSILK